MAAIATARRPGRGGDAIAARGERASNNGLTTAPRQSEERAVILAALAALDARRRALGCSQRALAAALGVSRSALARTLAGHPATRGPAAGLLTRDGLRRIELALRLLGGTASPAAPAAPKRRASRAVSRSARAEPSAVCAAAEPTAPGSAARPLRILIAEDDPDTVALYTMVLTDPDEQVRYDLTVARTAGACVELLAGAAASAAPFDLLLMDLGIGDARLGGPENTLLRQLRARPELVPPRVLVVSGISPYQLEHKQADLAALRAAFLPKPFDIDELAGAVRGLCLRGRAPGVRAFA